MKSDHEILIDHLQSEYDYLKSSMDECVAEWDFDGAKAFREPLILTKRKLILLKSLENSNFSQINRLTDLISMLEKSLNERKFKIDLLDEVSLQRMEEHSNQKSKDRINYYQTELEKLKSIKPRQRIDDDKLLELLERLERHEINEIEFELKKDKISLILRINNDRGEIKFRPQKGVNLESYFLNSKKSILRNLGYSIEIYRKDIPNFHNLDKIKILEELAIIYFEVFGIFGKKINVKIK